MSAVKINPRSASLLEVMFHRIHSDDSNIRLMSLCTMDGFSLASASDATLQIPADKIAAMASTMCSLGDAFATQLHGVQPNIVTVETEQGPTLIVKTIFGGLDCVLIVATNSDASIGKARYFAKRLAERIPQLKH